MNISTDNINIEDSYVILNNYINNKNCDFNNPISINGKTRKGKEFSRKVTDEYFVYVWTMLHAEGIDAIAQELKISKAWVYYRYLRLKEEGVPLEEPAFDGRWPRADVAKLEDIIRLTQERKNSR